MRVRTKPWGWLRGGFALAALVAGLTLSGCASGSGAGNPPGSTDGAEDLYVPACDATFPEDWESSDSSARTVNLIMINCSSETLQYDAQWDDWVTHGELRDSDFNDPAAWSGQLAAGTGRGFVQVDSDGFLTGAEATGYLNTVTGKYEHVVQINAEDPYAGADSFSCGPMNDAPLKCQATGITGGDHLTVAFVIVDADSSERPTPAATSATSG